MTELHECPVCETNQLSYEGLKQHCLKVHGRTLINLIPIVCNGCEHDMEKIPDVTVKGNWDGITRSQCINEACAGYKEIIEIPAAADMQTVRL